MKKVTFPILTLTDEASPSLSPNVHKTSVYTVPGLETKTGHNLATILQSRLEGLYELQLILKHAHWNVVGAQFIAIHEMLDDHVDQVREFVDEMAERIATLGVSPNGLSGNLVAKKETPDYPLGRATPQAHLSVIDKFYSYNIESHRVILSEFGELDPITEDLLVAQTRALEKLQWFIRAHLDNGQGVI